MEWGLILAGLGITAVVVCGLAVWVGKAGQAVAGVVAEEPEKFGSLLILQLLPGARRLRFNHIVLDSYKNSDGRCNADFSLGCTPHRFASHSYWRRIERGCAGQSGCKQYRMVAKAAGLR